jgi:hypothetical protein
MPSAVSLLKAVDDHNAAATESRRGSTVSYRLEDFTLDPAGKKIQGVDIATAVLDTSLTLTIEGASTLELTLLDKKLSLLRGDLLTKWAWGTNADDRNEDHWIIDGRKVDAQLDDLWFRLVKVSKQTVDTLVLTFEDRIVAALRAHRGARKMYREKFTRAQFVKALCDAAGVPYYIPELLKKQPISAPSQEVGITERRKQGHKGISTKRSGIKVKDVAADGEQLRNIQKAMDVANSLNAPERAVLAMCCAGIAESGFRSVANFQGSNYTGVFQGSKDIFSVNDTTREAHYFLKGGKGFNNGGGIHLAHKGLPVGEIATLVESGGKPASFYGVHLSEAQKIYSVYHGRSGVTSDTSVNIVVAKPFAFARGKNENSWDAIQRLAEEVNFRAFVRDGRLWYVSEEFLFNQAPQIDLVEGEDGVDEVTFDIDLGSRNEVTELQASAHAERWTVLPGMVAMAHDQGPADGRWIVHQIEGSLTTDIDPITVTLNKSLPVKPEPAPETDTLSFTIQGEQVSGQTVKGMTPKEIIDRYVLPIGTRHHLKTASGAPLTPGNVAAANARHGPTVSGGRSDHQGPPSQAWAVDMSNGYDTPDEERCAEELAKVFGIPYRSSGGLFNHTAHGFRFQLIHRTMIGGNHFNHVHMGVRRA